MNVIASISDPEPDRRGLPYARDAQETPGERPSVRGHALGHARRLPRRSPAAVATTYSPQARLCPLVPAAGPREENGKQWTS